MYSNNIATRVNPNICRKGFINATSIPSIEDIEKNYGHIALLTTYREFQKTGLEDNLGTFSRHFRKK